MTSVLLSFAVVLTTAHAAITPVTPPRAAYWCASLFESATHASDAATARGENLSHGIGETVGRPQDLIAGALAREGAAGTITRLRAMVGRLLKRSTEVLIRGEDDVEPRLVARALARLNGLSRDLRLNKPGRVPIKIVLRDRGAIHDFLLRQARVAENFERLHPAESPYPGRKPKLAWEPLFDVTLALSTVATWAGLTVALFDSHHAWTYLYPALDLTIAGLSFKPTRAALGEVIANVRARSRWGRVFATKRSALEMALNTELRARLRAKQVFDPEEDVIYHGYAVDVPAGFGPLDAAMIAGATRTGDHPGPGRRRLLVDQIFQVDPSSGEPTLTLVVRDHGWRAFARREESLGRTGT